MGMGGTMVTRLDANQTLAESVLTKNHIEPRTPDVRDGVHSKLVFRLEPQSKSL